MGELIERRGRVSKLQFWLAKRKRPRLGLWGEWIAMRHLLDMKWDLVARNWTTTTGEIDLIAYDEDFLVFLEVKTRLRPALLAPEAAIHKEKRDQIERLSISFRRRFELTSSPVRFDLIAIETPNRRDFELRHYLGFM